MRIVYLENSLVSFGFEEATGNLVEMVDKVNNRSCLSKSKHAGLFRIVAPNKLWMSRFADSQHAKKPEIFEADGELTFTYMSLEALDGPVSVEAMVRVVLPEDSAEAVFTLTLSNHGKDRVQEVRFPWVGGIEPIDGREHDRALAGCLPIDMYPPENGEIFANNLGNSHRRVFYNNAQMMLPFVDISGKNSGISYICHSHKPRAGGVLVENLDSEPNGYVMSLSWVHMPFVEEGQMWTSPPIGIGVHSGNWHATAERYREIAAKWWRAPILPDKLKESIGFQVVQLRTIDGKPLGMFRGIPKIAEEAQQYGINDLCVLDPLASIYLRPDDGDFWEEYDSNQTLDDLRYSLAIARDFGVNVSTLVNYRLIRKRSPQYMAFGEELVQRTVFGAPLLDDHTSRSCSHADSKPAYLGQCGTVLCQRSAGFVKRALEITRKTMHLGFSSLFIGQTYDANPCLSESHGHASPDDTPEAAVDWVMEAAPLVRAQSSDSYLIGENCDAFMSQHVDVSWNWNWGKLAAEVMRYTFPETLLCFVVDRQIEVLNRAFVLGCLAAFTTDGAEGTLIEYPEFAAHVKELADLRKKTMDYVSSGLFRDNIGLELSGVAGAIYESADYLTVIAAECEGKDGNAQISVDLSDYGRENPASAKLVTSSGAEVDTDWQTDGTKIVFNAKLKPYEVAVLAFECPQPKVIELA